MRWSAASASLHTILPAHALTLRSNVVLHLPPCWPCSEAFRNVYAPSLIGQNHIFTEEAAPTHHPTAADNQTPLNNVHHVRAFAELDNLLQRSECHGHEDH